jgi:hypothetical protein
MGTLVTDPDTTDDRGELWLDRAWPTSRRYTPSHPTRRRSRGPGAAEPVWRPGGPAEAGRPAIELRSAHRFERCLNTRASDGCPFCRTGSSGGPVAGFSGRELILRRRSMLSDECGRLELGVDVEFD